MADDQKYDVTGPISSWGDLERFGIRYLTGEECGCGQRLTVDLTSTGKKILMQAIGVQDIRLNGSWNGGGAVGSALVHRDLLRPLAIFALLDAGYEVADQGAAGVFGIRRDPAGCWTREEIIRIHGDPRMISYRGTAPGGAVNVHLMSGRNSEG